MKKSYELDLSHAALDLCRFHYKDGVLSAEESDLRDHSFDGQYRWLQRLYNDACDIGIAIRSPSGRTEKFVLAGTDENSDQEIMAWHFTPVNPNLRTVKEVIIFND